MSKSLYRFFAFLLIYYTTVCSVQAQYSYYFAEDIDFVKKARNLHFPMAGGLNSPNFSQIDIDLDGKLDLIILEKFGNTLYPFINEGDSGEISYSYQAHYVTQFPDDLEEWVITADFNCDGKMDLFVYNPISMIVYENISSASTGFQLGNPQKLTYLFDGSQWPLNSSRIDKPAIYDVDVDGDLDILVFGDIQIFYFKNMSIENTASCGIEFSRISKCWGQITENGFSSEIHLDTCFRGEFDDAERRKSNKHAGSSLMAFDQDGNKTTDLLVGDVSQSNLTLLVNGDITPDRSSSHIVSLDTLFPSYDTSIKLLSFPAAYYLDINNDQLKDLIVASFNSDRMEITQTEKMIHYYQNIGSDVVPIFSLQQKDFILEDMIDLGRGAHPVFFDHNKDGLLDIVAGSLGSYDSTSNTFKRNLTYFENTGSSIQAKFSLKDTDYANISQVNLQSSSGSIQALYPTFADINGDGNAEMMLGDEIGRLHLFTDTSNSGSPAAFKLIENNFDQIDLFRYASPQFYDLNKDGLTDLLVGLEYGNIHYFPNWGTATAPVFNLIVDSVIFIKDSLVRYYFDPQTNIYRLKVGDSLNFFGNNVYFNNGYKKILSIDSIHNFVDVLSPYINSQNFVNEYSSGKMAFYGNEKLGGIDIRNKYAFNGNATPFFYDYEGNTQLLSGSKIGTIYLYTGIDNRLDSNFILLDSNYLSHDFGRLVYLSGGDINNDNKVDLIIGNEAGGFKIFYANFGTGTEEIVNAKQSLKVFPNPTTAFFTMDLGKVRSSERFKMRVSNLLGQEIQNWEIHGPRHTFSTENLSNGIYIIQVYNPQKSFSGKIVVRH